MRIKEGKEMRNEGGVRERRGEKVREEEGGVMRRKKKKGDGGKWKRRRRGTNEA